MMAIVICLVVGLSYSVRAQLKNEEGTTTPMDSKESALKLLSKAYQPLPLGSIQPKGWLEVQLRIQAEGLTGHLDEFWPDIQDSGWIGGKAEG